MFMDNMNAQVFKKLAGFEEEIKNLQKENEELRESVCLTL
jgi:hypothetical protein